MAAELAAPASSFAALLRRSKFASFDPKIAQVYYTYGGDAHRGNWGLKRPLPLRRRMAHITVGAVDSKEQQTEWNHAATEARWMKMWDEVGIYPETPENAPWATRLGPSRGGTVDSEFARTDEGRQAWKEQSSIFGPQSSAVPNIEAMSNKQFNAYIARLRKLRPAFLQFVRDLDKKGTYKRTTWEVTRNPGNLHEKFLSREAYKFYDAPESRVIEQQPSKAAGLSYAKASLLQSFLYSKAHKGRILQPHPTGRELMVGYAGMNVFLPSVLKANSAPIDWDQLAIYGELQQDQGVSEFRYVRAQLRDAPKVVGTNPQGIEGLKMEPYVMDTQNREANFGRTIHHRPGSKEYSGQADSTTPTHLFHQPKAKEPKLKDAAAGQQVLSTLQSVLNSEQITGRTVS